MDLRASSLVAIGLLLGGSLAPPSLAAADGSSAPAASAQTRTVPLGALAEVRVDTGLFLKDGVIRLSPTLRALAALDDDQTRSLESTLTTTYDGFRRLLANQPPKIQRSGSKVTLTVRGIGDQLRGLRRDLDDSLTKLHLSLRLGKDQAPLLQRCITASFNNNRIIPGLSWPSSAATESLFQSFTVTFEPARDKTWLVNLSVESASGRSSWSCVEKTLPEFTRVFLPGTGLPDDDPLPEVGTRFALAEPLPVRSTPDLVPLALLTRLLGERQIHFDSRPGLVAVITDARIAPSELLRRLCGLDSGQQQAVESVWSEIFASFRRTLASHPPKVTTRSRTSAKLRFSDLRPALEPLKARVAQDLEPLVAVGSLDADQVGLLNLVGEEAFSDITFAYGRNLEEVILEFTDVPGSGRRVWSTQANTGRFCGTWKAATCGAGVSVEDSASGYTAWGSGDAPLAGEFRAFLSFVTFAANEALPPVGAAATGTAP